MTAQPHDLARMRREYQALAEMAQSTPQAGGVGPAGDHGAARRGAGDGAGGSGSRPEPDGGEDPPGTWLDRFARWLDDAVESGMPEPNAMVLATADADGHPSARSVLLKGYDSAGFTFFTNYGSRKGRDLAANPHASLVFPWYALHRQVIVCGTAYRVDRAETEEYFAVRPRGAQLGAWASRQSTVIDSRAVLEQELARAEARFPDRVPAPPHWGGFRVVPVTVEFWAGRPSRLHDRWRYRRTGDNTWTVERLAP